MFPFKVEMDSTQKRKAQYEPPSSSGKEKKKKVQTQESSSGYVGAPSFIQQQGSQQMQVKIDLLKAFTSSDDCKETFQSLTEAIKNVEPAVGVLALEGLYRIENEVKSGHLQAQVKVRLSNKIVKILQKWRGETLQGEAYENASRRAPDLLSSLTIFRTFEVLLPIEDYRRRSLSVRPRESHGGELKKQADLIKAVASQLSTNENEQKKKVDLFKAFSASDDCKEMFESLTRALERADPAVAVLALEGLYRIENDVHAGQFPNPSHSGNASIVKDIRWFLRNWRCESPLSKAYEDAQKSGAIANRRAPVFEYNIVPTVLRSLTIFKTFAVPLFISYYGTKELLSSFEGKTEKIHINEHTPIYHITHSKEAQEIWNERRLKPSDNMNIVSGIWFGLDNERSIFGSKSFKTTLSNLCVPGLRQGEIVSYNGEVNVILYAADVNGFEHLQKPTLKAAKMRVGNNNTNVRVSIFVPLSQGGSSLEIVSKPSHVRHGPVCAKGEESGFDCVELSW